LELQRIIEQNRTNHYKLLVIVDNNQQHQKIIDLLKGDGWVAYDVNESILKIIKEIPKEKIKLRIGDQIKKWVKSLPEKIILYNTNILYSPELGKLTPVGAFKYKARDREIILFVEGHVSGNRIQYSTYGREDHADMDVGELIHVRLEDIDA
jgi:hypothetical protein